MNVTEEGPVALVRRRVSVYGSAAMRQRFVILGVFALFVSACGDGGGGVAGSDSTLVGAACAENAECDLLLCQQGDEMPGGICTVSCSGNQDCPSRSACAVLTPGWLCMVSCAGDADCRPQYSCQNAVQAPRVTPASCTLPGDDPPAINCPSGFECINRRCIQCAEDTECQPGFRCFQGVCNATVQVCVGDVP
jgi:hypothetical protein